MVEGDKENSRTSSVHKGNDMRDTSSNKSFGIKKKPTKEFHINGVLREAREDYISVPSGGLKQNFSKVKLDPILKL